MASSSLDPLFLPLTPEQEQLNIKYNGPEPESFKALDDLKAWLLDQPHLPDTWDEQYLMRFLGASCYNLDICKRKLDAYFTYRSLMPQYFTGRNINCPRLQAVVKLLDGVVLKGLTPRGERVLLGRLPYPELDSPVVEDAIRFVMMMADLRFMTEGRTSPDIYILDAGFNVFKYFLKIPLLPIGRWLQSVQETLPCVIRQVHVINASFAVHVILGILKPFMGYELRKSIRVHSGMETLFEFVPQEMLPSEYGGNAGTIEEFKRRWIAALEEFGPWFERQESVKSDESKRRKVKFW